jgi:hypothetical protein
VLFIFAQILTLTNQKHADNNAILPLLILTIYDLNTALDHSIFHSLTYHTTDSIENNKIIPPDN